VAEAAAPRVDPVGAEAIPFLDRRMGYVSARWAVVGGAAIAGALVGLIVGVEIDRGAYDPVGAVPVALAGIGLVVGGAVAGVVVLLQSVRERTRPRRGSG